MDEWVKLYGPYLTALVPSLIGIWQFVLRQRAEEALRHSSDALALRQAMRDELRELRERIEDLEDYISQVEGHIDQLHADMIQAGLKPPPRPRRARRMAGGPAPAPA